MFLGKKKIYKLLELFINGVAPHSQGPGQKQLFILYETHIGDTVSHRQCLYI